MLATCNVQVEGKPCHWQVPWDQHGKVLMEEHFRDKHPGVDLYQNHAS